MANTDHIKQYSAADIQRYLDGKMLPAEMHGLEQAALDDPFLADAIEGLQQTLAQHDASLIDTHLQELGHQLEERVQKDGSKSARVIAFSWWKAAAAAIIVITGSIWAFNAFLQSDKARIVNEQLAVVKPQTRPDSIVPPVPAAAPENEIRDTAFVSHNYSLTTDANAKYQEDALRPENRPLPELAPKKAILPQEKAVAASEPTATRESLNPTITPNDDKQVLDNLSLVDSTKANQKLLRQYQLKADNSSIAAKTKPADNQNKNYNYFSNTLDKVYKSKADYDQIVIAKAARDSNAIGFYTKPREQEMNRSRKELSEKQAKKNPEALLSGFISGRVTDQANNPLYNATVRVDNTNRDFYTDPKGYFNIPVKDSIVNVAVGYSGYYTQNIKLLNNSDNNISLNQLGVKPPNPLLNESLQTPNRGFDTLQYKAVTQDLGLVNTKLGRQKAMIQYAEPEYGWLEYQQYLEKNKRLPAGTPDIKGTVTISFQVNKKGALSDFKVEQSLGKAYDEEAIRLIKAGPSWKLTSGRKAKATVVVNF